MRIDPFTSSARASGGRENAASSTRPALMESVAVWLSSFVPSSFRAFISSVRNTHPGGILQVNPNAALRYTPALTEPALTGDSAGRAFCVACVWDLLDDDVESCADACA